MLDCADHEPVAGSKHVRSETTHASQISETIYVEPAQRPTTQGFPYTPERKKAVRVPPYAPAYVHRNNHTYPSPYMRGRKSFSGAHYIPAAHISEHEEGPSRHTTCCRAPSHAHSPAAAAQEGPCCGQPRAAERNPTGGRSGAGTGRTRHGGRRCEPGAAAQTAAGRTREEPRGTPLPRPSTRCAGCSDGSRGLVACPDLHSPAQGRGQHV